MRCVLLLDLLGIVNSYWMYYKSLVKKGLYYIIAQTVFLGFL